MIDCHCAREAWRLKRFSVEAGERSCGLDAKWEEIAMAGHGSALAMRPRRARAQGSIAERTQERETETIGASVAPARVRRPAPVLPCCGRIVATGAARRARARGNAPRQVRTGDAAAPTPAESVVRAAAAAHVDAPGEACRLAHTNWWLIWWRDLKGSLAKAEWEPCARVRVGATVTRARRDAHKGCERVSGKGSLADPPMHC